MPAKKAPRTSSDSQGVLQPAPAAANGSQTPLASAEPAARQSDQQETTRPTGLAVRHEAQGAERVLDAVVTRVISTLDVDGLSKELTNKLADQLLGRVKVDALVSQILDAQAEALMSRLTDRLTAKLLGLGP